MMKTRLRYCVFDPDRRGNPRYYVRQVGKPKVRIKAAYKDDQGNITPEFMAEYWAALAVLNGMAEPKKEAPREETFDWLVDQYFRSQRFQRLNEATRRDKRSVLLRFCETAGALPYKKFRKKDMEASQFKRRETPGAADKLVKVMRALYNWAIDEKLAVENPAARVGKINNKSEGFHTWTPEEVDRFRAFHPLGSKPRLAMEIMINVGARISDACRLGRQHETMINGRRWLKFTAEKNRDRFPVLIEVPMTSDLIKALERTETGDLAYLVTSFGKPFVKEGLGNKMREWCNQAGLKRCSAHGLRKAAAVIMAESEVSAPELCAAFGWRNLSTAQIYIREAEKRRLSRNAFERVERFRNRNVSLSKAKNADETY
ncbi:tyrosine-type recombinase/integrase [Martelella lutilitoris]|uniref:Tyrosine-type recombinase/integrase n=2 Tax=Martelella lutilitoris TaxID=2583532 RepID=A0A7T7KN77_9HYPH|nr:tyrosine-type recombinase/integrase [Martelella lutilitoris]